MRSVGRHSQVSYVVTNHDGLLATFPSFSFFIIIRSHLAVGYWLKILIMIKLWEQRTKPGTGLESLILRFQNWNCFPLASSESETKTARNRFLLSGSETRTAKNWFPLLGSRTGTTENQFPLLGSRSGTVENRFLLLNSGTRHVNQNGMERNYTGITEIRGGTERLMNRYEGLWWNETQ